MMREEELVQSLQFSLVDDFNCVVIDLIVTGGLTIGDLEIWISNEALLQIHEPSFGEGKVALEVRLSFSLR